MTIVQSQSNIPARSANIAVGRYHTTATAAAFKITTGFQPRYVKVQNEGSLGSEEWYEGMTAAYAIRTASGVTATLSTTAGITVAADGFTVGLDTVINIIDEQLAWIAIG